MQPRNGIVAPLDRLTWMVKAAIDGGADNRLLSEGILRPAAFIFKAAVLCRSQYYRRCRQRATRLPCRVVSIGNLTTGGTGKTPMCVYLARLIHDAGYRVTIISRGYGGGAEKKGAVAESGASAFADAQRFGDEPALMARLLASRPIAVLVGRDRISSGWQALKRFQPDVILLDDGFQHQRLARDLNIVLLDAQKPLGNGHLLPRGPLREPPCALGRADILVMTRYPTETAGAFTRLAGQQELFGNTRLAAKPLFACQHAPVVRSRLVKPIPGGFQTRSLELAMLKGMPVIAFAGIARSEAFRQTVVELGADLRGWRSFDDHHPFYRVDIEDIVNEGCRQGAVALVTTDKDRMRIRDDWIRKLPLLVIGVEIDFGSDAEAFNRLVLKRLDLKMHRKV